MPKYGIHHVVLADAIDQRLLVDETSGGRQAGEILDANRGIAMLGAVGPDLFFFGPDYDAIAALVRLYENIEDFVEIYEAVMAPIKTINETVIEPAQETVESLGGETVQIVKKALEEVRETAALLRSAVNSTILAGVLAGVNAVSDIAFPKATAVFFDEVFRPPLQDGKPVDDWYWFDMLHYRRTGQFTRQLRELARNDEQRAYAYGYMSHVATDVVGHPYVNEIVGGPYRLNMQRHVTVENYMDCWTFDRRFGRSVNGALLGKLGLPHELPDSVGALLNEAFRATYDDPGQHPHRPSLAADGFYTQDQIHETFAIFRRVLVTMERMSVTRPSEPFAGAADIVSAAMKDFVEPPPKPPTIKKACSWESILSFGLSKKSRDCYKTFFEDASEWIKYAGQLLAYTFETLLDLVDLLLALLLSLPIMVLLALLYGIQLACYQAYLLTHAVLAQHGLLFPEPADLQTSYGVSLITPALACADAGYPRATDLEIGHLVCPTGGAEDPATIADFHPATAQTTPEAFIGERPLDLAQLKRYAECADPAATRELQTAGSAIGNATDFTAWMIRAAAELRPSGTEERMLFTDWNLDADRGYGYKAWFGDIVANGSGGEIRNERYGDIFEFPRLRPSITRVDPAGPFISGEASGGEEPLEFRVGGEGFQPAAAVSFSSSTITVKATRFESDRELVAETVVRSESAISDVTVTNPDGTSAVRRDAVGVNIKG